jgi:hypothetical protein
MIILLDAVLILSLFFFYPFLFSPNKRLSSNDWGGYVVASDLNFPQPSVTGVNGSWTVPRVNSPPRSSFSAVWIGIGGDFSDTSLIQVGTEQNILGERAEYSAWYEMLPSDSVTIDSLTVSSGDEIIASIYLVNSSADLWRIQIHNANNNESFQIDVVYSSSMLSAEWILEDPYVNNHPATLANFSSATFGNCFATLGGKAGSINSYPHIQYTMYDRLNRQQISVSSISSEGTSFTVSYLT